MARGLVAVREGGGRLFILGVGGGAGHASHAVNDFRKLCRIESYAPTDNVSELTARTNDDGWDTSYSAWLEVSRLTSADALLVFWSAAARASTTSRSTSSTRSSSARSAAPRIYGVVGAPGGTLAELADVVVRDRRPGGAARRRWSSPSRRSSGTRSSPIPSWPCRPGHWESLDGRRAAVTGARAVFVDRDGVLNELVPDPVSGLPESPLQSRRRAADARRCGRRCGGSPRPAALLVGVSNQPAAAKGTIVARRAARGPGAGARAARRRGRALRRLPALPAPPRGRRRGAERALRLPQAGAGDAARARRRSWRSTWRASWMIGDTDADVRGRARAPGCRTVLVEHPGSAHKRQRARRPGRPAQPICRPRQPTSILGVEGPLEFEPDAQTISTSRSSPTAPTSTAILALAADPRIAGFTTNPTLMWKAGLTDYAEFAQRLLERITDAPDLVRGLRRRRRRDAPPGADDRRLGRRTSTSRSRSRPPRASRWRRWCASCPRTASRSTSPRCSPPPRSS